MKRTFSVLDSNMLNSPLLEAYLQSSKGKIVILPDYIAMEAYKGNEFTSIIKSMKTLSKYPAQVQILKGTQANACIHDTEAILKWRFVDKDQSATFSEYCEHLKIAENGKDEMRAAIMKHVAAANDHMNKILLDASGLMDAFRGMKDWFNEDELKIIRRSEPYTLEMMQKFMRIIGMIAYDLYDQRPNRDPKKDKKINIDMFVYRFAVAGFFLCLKWISRGNPEVKSEKIRNDLVDTIIVTYSTYYDDLLSYDKDMLELRDMTKGFLSIIN